MRLPFMRASLFLGPPFALLLSSCTQAPPLETRQASTAVVVPAVPPKVAAITQAPSSPAGPPQVARREIAGITFEGLSFDASTHRLVVVDQLGGPGSRFADARSAGLARQGIAAINAGFFTPEGAPLGKLIAAGNPAGSWNRASSLGSGVFQEDSSGSLVLSRRETVSPNAVRRELLQAGPMLVENGRTVSGLDAEKPAVRIVLLWDGGSRWWLGRGSSCTLAELGRALGGTSPAGWPVHSALNLDGGRSADLWISEAVPGGPIVRRSAWNRPVRNFLVLVPR